MCVSIFIFNVNSAFFSIPHCVFLENVILLCLLLKVAILKSGLSEFYILSTLEDSNLAIVLYKGKQSSLSPGLKHNLFIGFYHHSCCIHPP